MSSVWKQNDEPAVVVEWLNLTPHDIVVVDDEKNILKTFPKSGRDVRLATSPQTDMPFQTLGVPVVTRQTFTSLIWPSDDMPRKSWLLVSMPVGEFLATHPEQCEHWVFGPDTGPAAVVRDQRGQIVGTKRLVFYAAPRGTLRTCCSCSLYDFGVDPKSCPACDADIDDRMLYIAGTHLFMRQGKLIRTPKAVKLPFDGQPGLEEAIIAATTFEPEAKKVRLSPTEKEE
jgi:hypothetical protein